MKFALFAAAAALAAPAVFAQQTLSDETTYLVAPGRTHSPGNSGISDRAIPGAVVAEERGVVQVVALGGSASTATMGAAPAAGNRYWFNVPQDVERRADFRRWRGLL